MATGKGPLSFACKLSNASSQVLSFFYKQNGAFLYTCVNCSLRAVMGHSRKAETEFFSFFWGGGEGRNSHFPEGQN